MLINDKEPYLIANQFTKIRAMIMEITYQLMWTSQLLQMVVVAITSKAILLRMKQMEPATIQVMPEESLSKWAEPLDWRRRRNIKERCNKWYKNNWELSSRKRKGHRYKWGWGKHPKLLCRINWNLELPSFKANQQVVMKYRFSKAKMITKHIFSKELIPFHRQ